MKKVLFAMAVMWLGLQVQLVGQCSSLYTTPEFPIATHPSDQHTMSWGTNLFLQSQMGGAANFTGIQIYVDNSFGPTTYANQTVWLRHSAVTSYPNALYPTTAGFIQCFSGTYSFPMSGLYTIAFNVAAFAYNGSSNVEILFENRSNVYRVNEPWFRRTPTYGAGVYRSKWNGNFGFGGFPGTASDGSAVRLTYNLSLTAVGGGGCGAVLPVAFPDFAAVPEGKAVHCAWDIDAPSTSEIVLERSMGDAQFQALARFPAGASGHFDWTDAQPNAEINLYRLRSQDANGTTQLSSMVLVDRSGMGRLKMYAFGTASGIDLIIDSPDARLAELKMTDLQGKILHQQALALEAGRNHLSLPSDVAAGLLLVHLHAEGESTVLKVYK